MSSVCAIVVTYGPGPEVLRNLAAIRAQVTRLVVVDNAATAASRDLLQPLAADAGSELVFNVDNRGLAAALNQGVGRALAAGADWVATFDQDSLVPANYFAGLLAAYAAFPGRARVGIVAPVYRDRGLGFRYSPYRSLEGDTRPSALVGVTLTSGNLVKAAALADGGFREDFFIDCVDFEFCLRLRRAGWQILEVRTLALDHEQGAWVERRWLGRTVKFNDYPALRRYYQTRNRVILHLRYFTVDPRWILRDAWGYPKEIVKLVLFGTSRGPKLRAVLRGAWHALDGRRGR